MSDIAHRTRVTLRLIELEDQIAREFGRAVAAQLRLTPDGSVGYALQREATNGVIVRLAEDLAANIRELKALNRAVTQRGVECTTR